MARPNSLHDLDNDDLLNIALELHESCKVLMYYYDAFRDKTPKGPTEIEDIAACREILERAEAHVCDDECRSNGCTAR